jgi:signal transduction histidine kinase
MNTFTLSEANISEIDLTDMTIGKMHTILVVDDTADNLILMNNLLKSDYRVKVVNSGEKALKIAMSDSPPDLILLDIMMPDMDGYEVCQRLKGDPKSMNIPVIFLTAKVEMEDEQKGLGVGAVDYITKPISPPIVMARVKNHLALQDKNHELMFARAVAEKANLAKSKFLSSMSHELRSPLNAILGFAQLMESDTPPLTPNQKESTDQILKAGWHLLTLVNEILDLAKVESGCVPLLEESVALNELLLDCQNMIEPQSQQREITLDFPQQNIPFFVYADKTRLKQVLINLLSNAIKYNSKPGSIKVNCSENVLGRVRISVTDTGAGLSAEQLTMLFQPFNRLGQETGIEEGTGIGLVVAKQMVELMGGSIGVESTLGVGSVFWFELVSVEKLHAVVEQSTVATITQEPATQVAQEVTLLYIENEIANLNLVEQIIDKYPNLNILTAENGNDGIAIARTAMPKAIILDIKLPDISGFEIIKILRADPSTANIPVLAISANAMPHEIASGIKAGFFRYITKPIKIMEFMHLLDIVLEYLQQDQTTAQLNQRAANNFN